MAFLADRVDAVLRETGAAKVVLVGNSRGGNTIRNYVQNGGGAARVSHVVLGGNPAHGIWNIPGYLEQNEFSARSAFLTQLNAPKGPNGEEVTPGVQWLTLRSDNNDKYAQPDGVWIGAPGKPTNIGFDGPALKGATNVVLPRVDHRETSFSPAAFAATWQFLTDQAPRSTDIARLSRPSPVMKIPGSRRRSRRTISSITSGVAVAVNTANNGRCGSSSTNGATER